MAQLKMFWRAAAAEYPQPRNGFTFRPFNGSQEDIAAWVDICKHGLLREDETGEACFRDRMHSRAGFCPEDVFFVLLDGSPAATITAIVQPDQIGYVHMVAAKPECRGRGVAAYMNQIAAARFWQAGCTGAYLTTDEWRVPAVRSYLRSGFLPVLYDEGMPERWTTWLTEQGYRNIEMTDEQGNFVQWLVLEKIKLGIFGARRGSAYAKAAKLTSLAEVVAVCDADSATHAGIRPHCADNVQFFTEFGAMLDSGIQAVVLANYFHQHAAFAIQALERDIHVFSETTAAVTLQACVALCRAAERSRAVYMLAENYPYYRAPLEIKKIVERGTLGAVLYADGEYVHPMDLDTYRSYTPSSKHWRAQMPSSYYLTHSLAPLMHITGAVPVKVNAKCVYAKQHRLEYKDEPVKDTAAIMLCQTDQGSLFRITGWAKYGPHGTWYRLCCENGGVEMPRDEEDMVRLEYNRWSVPQDEKVFSQFEADDGEDKEKAKQCGHGGSDYRVMKEFLRCLIKGEQPFFDVYKACTMAAVGILGWRSCLNHGQEYDIPDFRDETSRNVVENDNLSPFPDENGIAAYPCTMEGQASRT